MDGKTNPQSANNTLSGVPSSSLPLLSSHLNSLYNSLDDFNKGVFVKMYGFIWGVVNNGKHNPITSYWAVHLVCSSLPSSHLAVLTFLYQVSYKGVKYIHSNSIYNSPVLADMVHDSKKTLLNELKRAGYITRHTKDPGRPFVHEAQHNKQPVFIKMTNKGVKTIEDIQKDMNRILMNTSFNDLTGIKKPG